MQWLDISYHEFYIQSYICCEIVGLAVHLFNSKTMGFTISKLRNNKIPVCTEVVDYSSLPLSIIIDKILMIKKKQSDRAVNKNKITGSIRAGPSHTIMCHNISTFATCHTPHNRLSCNDTWKSRPKTIFQGSILSFSLWAPHFSCFLKQPKAVGWFI